MPGWAGSPTRGRAPGASWLPSVSTWLFTTDGKAERWDILDGPRSIYPGFHEVIDVYRRALRFGWLLFEETMPLLDKIQARPQDQSAVTYYNLKQSELLGDRRGFTRSAGPRARS